MAREYREDLYASRVVAAAPPEPTIGLIAFWILIFLVEFVAVLYTVHVYAHLV